ncbi:WD40 repeat domain-containing protein [Streptomyces sp. YU58]|uniref:WD40 repeat domain-containing protein n=1 Tax=Streptomyces sp. SX92 TaxID=3158972 RepID=UPI0027B88152|nr:WD40 repeat domain-containing protein [Streptomyces coralus]WLW54952.1 WD40 repeat domain-containing protein [Streptomyces coralus]
MVNRARWLGRAAVTLCVAAGVWLLVAAVRGGWDAADPVASVLGASAGIAALLVSLGFGPRAGTVAGDPPPPPAPAVPEWVVDRGEVEQIVSAVCARAGGSREPFSRRHADGNRNTAIAITTGLHGAGGFGKTTLAHVVCAHPKVRRIFRGRVYVVTIGRNVRGRAAIAAKVAEATRFITGDTLESGGDPGQAGDHLGRLLALRRRTLLVIDDVWEAEQLEPFLRGAEENCVRLVTTRRPAVLPPRAARIVVDRMSPAQARAALTHRLTPAMPESLTEALTKATGRWALLLRLVNQLIAVQMATGVDAAVAAREILDRLRALGPAGADPDLPLDLDDPARRNTAVRASIQAATALLPREGGRRFAELGVFAEDEAIPLPLVALLWRATGGLDEAEARALCMQMAELSLIGLDGSVTGGAIALHDVVRDYLRAELASDVAAVNVALLDAVAASLPSANVTAEQAVRDGQGDAVAWWETPDGYLLDHLVEHLLDAGRVAEAEAVTGDLRWVEARLYQRGPTAPWRDLGQIDSPNARMRAQDVVRAAHLLSPTDPPHALTSVLHSRLGALGRWHNRPYTPLYSSHPTLSNRRRPPDLPDSSWLRTLTGNAGAVHAIAFSPDGTQLAAGGDDKRIRLWDPVTGESLRTMSTEGRIRAIAFSPDGAVLAVGGDDGEVSLWDPTTGDTLRTVAFHVGGVTAVAFSPDGTRIVSAGQDGQAMLRQLSSGDVLARLGRAAPRSIRAVAFSPDGTLIAIGGETALELWDGTTGSLVRDLRDLTARGLGTRAVAFSPDSSLLVTGGLDRRVLVWDVTTGGIMRDLAGHAGYVNAVAYSPHATLLATAGYDQVVRLWDPGGGVEVRDLGGHEGYVNAVAFSPDGTLLATAGSDRAVRLRDPAIRSGGSDATGVRAVAVAADSQLATVDDDGRVRLWDPRTGSVSSTLTSYIRGVRTAAFRPDGAMLVTVGVDGQMWIWDPVRGSPVDSFPDAGIRYMRAAAFSPDGSVLAAADEHAVQLWDTTTGTVLRTLTGPGLEHVGTLLFSPDGTTLATANEQGSLCFWNPTTGSAHGTYDSGGRATRSMAFSADGTRLAVVSDEGAVHVWYPVSGTARDPLTDSGPVNAVAFNGHQLTTAGDDGTLRIWDSRAGRVLTLMRTDTSLRCCTWSADGRTLFAGGRAGLFAYDYRPGV